MALVATPTTGDVQKSSLLFIIFSAGWVEGAGDASEIASLFPVEACASSASDEGKFWQQETQGENPDVHFSSKRRARQSPFGVENETKNESGRAAGQQRIKPLGTEVRQARGADAWAQTQTRGANG